MKKIKNSMVDEFLKRYEEDYLYFNRIEDYDNKRAEILQNKIINLSELNIWLYKNVPSDPYTKFIFRGQNKVDLFYDYIFFNSLYIKTSYFDHSIANNIIKLIVQKQEKYLILDLRDNCGGSIEAAIAIIDCLVDPGVICSLDYRKKTILYRSEKNKIQFEKIYIFTNKNTMSSAELLTMSLILSNDNAYMVGNDTYRKGIGQISLFDRRTNINFSFSAFEWKIKGKSIDELYEEALIKGRILEVDEEAGYNDYMQVINAELESDSSYVYNL